MISIVTLIHLFDGLYVCVSNKTSNTKVLSGDVTEHLVDGICLAGLLPLIGVLTLDSTPSNLSIIS